MGSANVRISVRGRLSERLATAFEGMTLVRRRGRTEIVGEIVDQAQLHGLLARIRDLGLELEQVTLEEPKAQAAHKPGQKRRHDSQRRSHQKGD